jgi:hypothetical protein
MHRKVWFDDCGAAERGLAGSAAATARAHQGPSVLPPRYDVAARLAWDRTLAWFREKSRTHPLSLNPMGKPMEVSEMNNDDSVKSTESETTSNTPPTDTPDKPVDVDSDLDGEDQATTTQTQEQEAEKLRRKIAEIERKVADGN